MSDFYRLNFYGGLPSDVTSSSGTVCYSQDSPIIRPFALPLRISSSNLPFVRRHRWQLPVPFLLESRCSSPHQCLWSLWVVVRAFGAGQPLLFVRFFFVLSGECSPAFSCLRYDTIPYFLSWFCCGDGAWGSLYPTIGFWAVRILELCGSFRDIQVLFFRAAFPFFLGLFFLSPSPFPFYRP